MKLAKFAESDRAKKISKALVAKGRLLGVVLYCLGIGIYCSFPIEGYHRKKFFDENALLTGLVKREFRDSSQLSQLRSQYERLHHEGSDLQTWIGDVMTEFGLEVFRQNYTSDHQVLLHVGDGRVGGTNVYGILRAGRSSSVEAIVLTAPDVLANGGESLGVPVLLTLAKFFSRKNYLAKDVIFLVTSGGVVGMQSWVNAYLGIHSSVVTPDPLSGRSGALQAVVNIEIGRGNIKYINVIPEGVNAVLPNLDLVFVASSLCEMERLPITYHINWDSPNYFLNQQSPYFNSLLTSVAVLYHHATGLPLSNHAPFLSHRIDSVTLRGIHETREDKSHQLNDLARALEGMFRSINNLLERLHHSEFFYINMSHDTFVSIGQYSSFFGFLLAPLLLESIRQWILGRREEGGGGGATSSGKTFYERMGIPPSFTFSLKPLSLILVSSLVSGSALYYSPVIMKTLGLPLTPVTMFGGLTIVWLLATAVTFFIRPTMTKETYHTSCSLVLLLILVLLYSLAMMHFSFSFLLTILVSIPLSLSTLNSLCSQILLILFSPPLLLFYLCCGHTFLFPQSSPDASFFKQLDSSLKLLLSGAHLSYSYYYLSGAWLYPLCTLLLCPVWSLCWNLGLIGVKETTQQPHPHSD